MKMRENHPNDILILPPVPAAGETVHFKRTSARDPQRPNMEITIRIDISKYKGVCSTFYAFAVIKIGLS